MKTSQRLFMFLLISLLIGLAACAAPAAPPAAEEEEAPEDEEMAEDEIAEGEMMDEETGSPAAGGTINYTNFEPATLNPYLRPEQIAWQATALVSTGLVDLDTNGEWVLELAEEFPSVENGTVSEDGTVITWKLRPGLQWSDGTPLTSDDLVFTWEVCSNPASGCAINAGFDQIQSIETPDEQTAIVTYAQVYPAWMAQFRNGILPRSAGDPEEMPNWEWNRTMNPTNGPFMVQEWNPGDSIIFVRNPNYWEEGKPYLDQINWLVVPDTEVMRQMLLGGDSDLHVWVQSAPAVIETAEAGFTMGGGSSPYWNRIQFNLRNPENLEEPHPILGDKRVRDAILMGINREEVTYNWTVEGIFTPTLTTSLYDLWPQYACNLDPIEYDVEGAQALLEEAGWVDTDGDGIRECQGCEYAEEGTPLRMRVSTYTDFGQEDNQLVMVDALREIGVDLFLENYEATVMYSSWTDGSFMYRGDFDILWWDHDPGMPDPVFRTELYYTTDQIPSETNPAGMNMSGISDEEIDALAAEAGSMLDEEERQELYCQIADKVYNEYRSEQVQGVLPSFVFSSPRLKGWEVNELYSPAGWDSEDWYIEE